MIRTQFLLGAAFGLLTLTTTPGFAQAQGPKVRSERAHKSPDEKASTVTARMSKQLTLTPDQQTQVGALNTQLASDLSALHDARKADKGAKGARRAKAQAIRDAYQANLKATLTPEQYSLHEKYRAEQDQKHQARHAAHRAGHGKGPKGNRPGAIGQPVVPPGPAQQ